VGTKGTAGYPDDMPAEDAELVRSDVTRNRAALLDAAADVLAVAPQASLSEIAARAGLGRATLYRHFPSREALQAALREEALARAGAALAGADLEACATREAVRRAVAVLVPLGVRFRILLAEGVDADEEFVAARTAVLAPLWAALARGVERGELRAGTDPAWAALVLAGLLVTAARGAAVGLVTPEQAPDLVVGAFFDGHGP
jgi:TetR/AcrR family transcriptional regulator, mexCD-oprJ operon repressor